MRRETILRFVILGTDLKVFTWLGVLSSKHIYWVVVKLYY